MKKIIASLATVIWAISLSAQVNPRIVFDVTSTDTKVHQSTLLMMKVMSKDYPNTICEVMVYGEALPMLMKNQSTVTEEIEGFAENENIIFSACEVSMELIFNVGSESLLAGVRTVENAVPDIAIKQQSGWGYIKVAN